MIIRRLVQKFNERVKSEQQMLKDDRITNRVIDTDSECNTDFHNYILDQHAYYRCKQIFISKVAKSIKPPGLLEDFILYLLNHHKLLKCFCSFDFVPLTYTSKRMIFIGDQTILFLMGIILHGILVFNANLKGPLEYVISFFLSPHLAVLSAHMYAVVYRSIFIKLEIMVQANLSKSNIWFITSVTSYYLMCIVNA